MRRPDAESAVTRWEHFSVWNGVMAPSNWKRNAKSKITLRYTIRIYFRNNEAEFHPDSIQFEMMESLGFFE